MKPRVDITEPLREICRRMGIDYDDLSEVVIRLKSEEGRSEISGSSNFRSSCGCNCSSAATVKSFACPCQA